MSSSDRSSRLTSVALVFLGVVGGVLLSGLASTLRGADSPREVTPRGALHADEQATIDLFSRVSPSVVSITTLEVYRDFVPDLKPVDASPALRGLAEVCLVLLNSNEFAYIY